MRLQLEFYSDAGAEISEALAWAELTSTESRERLQAAIDGAVRQLLDFPQSGSVYLEGTRRLVLTGHPYSVVYVAEATRLAVVAFAHTSRSPGYWLPRL